MKIRNVIKLLLLVILLTIGGCWYYFKVYSKNLTEVDFGDQSGIIQEVTYISGDTLQSGIREMGELVTADYYFTRLETFEDNKVLDLTGWGIDFVTDIPLTSKSFSFSYDGQIKAGIDFTQVEVKVDEEQKQVIITMPEAKIVSCEIDPESYHFYEIKNNLFNPIDPEDYAVSLAELINAEKAKAAEGDLLKKASENARKIVSNFVSSFNLGDYKLIIR